MEKWGKFTQQMRWDTGCIYRASLYFLMIKLTLLKKVLKTTNMIYSHILHVGPKTAYMPACMLLFSYFYCTTAKRTILHQLKITDLKIKIPFIKI
jgi:hypothetical protein